MSARPAVVGGFILGALVLGVVGILSFGGLRWFSTTAHVVVFFNESLANLDVGSPVTFHGVRIGSVESMAIHFSGDTMTARIPVYLQIEPRRLIWEGKRFGGSAVDYEQLVQAGLRAQLGLQSVITGQLRVDLEFRPDTPAKRVGTVADVPEIPAIPSDLSQLRNQLTGLPLRELADTAQRTLASLGRLSEHLDAAVGPLTARVNRTADAATHTLQTTDAAVRRLQAEASIALHDLDTALVDAHRQLDPQDGQLSRTLASADRTLRRAETLLDSMNGLAEPRSQFGDDLEATMHDLAASASSLRNFAETIERNPNALLMGRRSR
ncbi:MAG: MlaD family protein [Methylocella sp.]